MNNFKLVSIVVLMSVFLIGGMAWGLANMKEKSGKVAGLEIDAEELVSGTEWVKENGEVKVTVVEFTDLQCSACRTAESVAQELAKMDGVRFVFRHLPLLAIHKNAWEAAVAAETARKLGKGWEMVALLFKKQSEWEKENDFDKKALEYAGELGLGKDEFLLIYEDSETEKQIIDDFTLANKLKFNGTPTFLVDGELVASTFVLGKVEEKLKEGK